MENKTNNKINKPAEKCGKIAICQRCHRLRAIYNLGKQLCGSCRILEPLHKDKKKYAEYLKKQREKWKDENYRKKKLAYNYEYYRTGDNAEKMKVCARRYFQEHKEKCNETKRKWIKEHPEQNKLMKDIYYKRNKKKIQAKNNAWRKRNKVKVREYNNKYIQKKKLKMQLEKLKEIVEK